ncbi:motility-associated protein, partial [Bosea sp. (in: a-proteobacteria)]
MMTIADLQANLNSPLTSIGHLVGRVVASRWGVPAAAQGWQTMRLIVGTIIVFACVFGSYAAMGGHLEVLWQPFEFVIILGAAIGAFIIGNPGPVLKAVPGMLGTIFKGPKYTQK